MIRRATIGLLIAIASTTAFVLALARCQPASLTVRVSAPLVAQRLSIAATLPRELTPRIRTTVNGQTADLTTTQLGPGLHRVQWSVDYRGGYRHTVGVSQLVGPFQNPQTPPCSARVYVGQKLLDDGQASPSTIAGIAKAEIEREMAGFSQFPLGTFTKVKKIRLTWVKATDINALAKLIARLNGGKQGATGILRVNATIAFSRGTVPVSATVIPIVDNAESIRILTTAKANVQFNNRVFNWLSKLLKGDRLATLTAQREIRSALKNAFQRPPPITLPNGGTVSLHYCTAQPIEVATGDYAALPLVIVLDNAPLSVRPIQLGTPNNGPSAPLPSPLSIELSVDSLNSLLYQLWHTGYLDRNLADANIHSAFNRDPLVSELLSVRISPPRLVLPPTVRYVGTPQFLLKADATIDIADGDQHTPGRVFGEIGVDFAHSDQQVIANITLHDLQLTCEPEKGVLAPCYSALVEQIRPKAKEIHGTLTQLFTAQFNRLLIDRRFDPGGGVASYRVTHAAIHATGTAPNGIMRIDLHGRLER